MILTGILSKDKVNEYLFAADVFALNTAYEGLSHQLIEAVEAGLRVLTTLVGGNPEIEEQITKKGYYGHIHWFTRDGVEDYFSHIKNIFQIQNNNEEAARRLAGVNLFPLGEMLDGYSDLFRNVCQRT